LPQEWETEGVDRGVMGLGNRGETEGGRSGRALYGRRTYLLYMGLGETERKEKRIGNSRIIHMSLANTFDGLYTSAHIGQG